MRLHLLLLLLASPLLHCAAACGGTGDAAHDWLVAGCRNTTTKQIVASTFTTSQTPDGSVTYALSNGIISRQFTHNATTKVLSTTAVKMLANETAPNLVTTVAPEASLTINGVPVQVGGVAGQIKGSHMALFRSVRTDLPAVAGGYAWIPGVRGSNPNAAWPPRGSRVEFDHEVRKD